ncbi:MAG TPA: basic amino acid ABC transporter substrate-binding protein [Clostridiaceae bacterium]|nr:basic amino acid ABC transporter substrate-binding protein [Clostridiaceae bacterium]
MKRIFKVLIALFLIAAIILAFAGCKKDEGIIKMGTNAEFPPFEYVENGEYVGIDVELAKAIAKELGKELVIEDMAFDALIDALNSGKVDFVAAGMTVNADREKNVDFTIKYYNASQTIVVRADNEDIKTKDDLVGKRIGVQTGTTGYDLAMEIKDAVVNSYNNGLEATMDLKNGNIDAVIIDNFPAKKYAERNSELKLIEGEFEEEQYAMAVKKGNKKLLDQINKALQKLMEDGTYDSILEKYSE